MTLLFGLFKLQHLAERRNPIINTNMMPIAEDESYDLSQQAFNIAFAAQNYETGEGISDPRYVKWMV